MVNLRLENLLLPSQNYIGLVLCICLLGCSSQKNESWSLHLRGQGTASSPRMVDLNQDGRLDIVLGVGGYENMPSDTAVIAVNGADGSLLWHVPARNQMVGSALFKDITEDNVPDVFIGGRTGELMAINGHNGEVIWRFYPLDTKRNPADDEIFNFYNPQLVADQDQDQLEDLLISNGGNYLIPPYEPNRPVGKLLVISSATGKILKEARMPDGKEIYMSPVKADLRRNGTEEVIFGTGGETIGGKLFRVNLQDVLQNDLSRAVILAESKAKGFIAPPILADITQDGILDIIANAVDGLTIAINGATNKLIWETQMPGTELYSSPAIGFFNADSIPDFFVNSGVGVWPRIRESKQSLINGKDGKIESQEYSGSFMYASPVVMDYNQDGFDDVLMNINDRISFMRTKAPASQLYILDFHQNTRYPISDTLKGKNIACTPWVGDLDKDGKIDIISSTIELAGRDNNDIDQPSHLRLYRLKTMVPVNAQPKWSAYMGPNYDGIFTSTSGKKIKSEAAPKQEQAVSTTKKATTR